MFGWKGLALHAAQGPRVSLRMNSWKLFCSALRGLPSLTAFITLRSWRYCALGTCILDYRPWYCYVVQWCKGAALQLHL